MSDATSSSLPLGPGGLIEAARRKQGLHIAALAAQLKVSPARLEALEREQWEKLPDLTNARALATTVCRALGLDPAPVLAGMPRASGDELNRVTVGLNEPVRSGSGLSLPRWSLPLSLLLLLGVALGLAFWPKPGVEVETAPAAAVIAETPTPEPVASELVAPSASASASLPAPSASPVVAAPVPAVAASAVTTAPTPVPTQATAPAVLPVGAALLEIRAGAGESWVSVVDASGTSLASRLLLPGESLSLQPQAPVRLVLGNAPALSLSWRGQSQALEGYEQRRVARLELK